MAATLLYASDLVAAVPGYRRGTTPPENGKSFSVRQVANPAFEQKGPAGVARSYARYGAPEPSTGLARRSQAGSVTAVSYAGDREYLCPVDIGDPAQTLYLDFDTGSADLWVFSTFLPDDVSSGHHTYDPSGAKLKEGETWSISYAEGSSASGVVYEDKVVIGGVTATSQAVEAATAVSQTFIDDAGRDGLVGLAFSSINTVTPDREKTFSETVLPDLGAPLFAANLKYHTAGNYDFGFIDASAYIGDIAYVPVDSSDGFWTFVASEFTVGHGNIISTPLAGIADTGTSLLLLDSSVVTAYYAKVPDSQAVAPCGGDDLGCYVFPCSTILPNFSFTVGSNKITIPGNYMSYGQFDDTYCIGGIQNATDTNVFGDIALKAAYVVFDLSGPQLGWASKPLA